MIRFALFGLAGLPGLFWAARGIAGAFLGLGPGFGPGALGLVWALARIRRRKRSGKGCGSCSASCPYHDHCKS